MKEKVYQPLPTNMAALKSKVRAEFGKIPEVMVQKSIMKLKKRGDLMVGVEGQQFEGRRQAVEE